MFSHVMVGADDIEASKRFYDTTFGALGYPSGSSDPSGRVFYPTPSGSFAVTRPLNGEKASAANGGTIGFIAQSPDQVDAWHAAGLANGGTTCESPPGPRDVSGMKLYTAYLRDPAGNKICAVHHRRQ